MKKFTLIALFIAIGTTLMAQVPTKSGDMMSVNKANQPQIISSKAVGDTLVYFNGNFFDVNATDMANFGFVNESIDGLSPNNPVCNEFCYYYATDLVEYGMPWDVDSAFYMTATSWFNPAGQADNWFAFGPITIPATGAIVQWYIRCNPGYRDGYEVSVSGTGMSNYTDFSGGIYSRTDAYPSPTEATDTIWQLVSAAVPSQFAGQQAYVGFHHNANDMDVLWLDEITVIEANNVGISETAKPELNIYPNPASNMLNLNSNETIDQIRIMNVIGQDVLVSTPRANKAVLDISSLENGVYFVSVEAGNQKTVKKLTVKR